MPKDFLMAFFYFIGVIGLIFLTYFGAKWLNKKFRYNGISGSSNGIKVIECIGIAQDKQLMVVSVGKKNMLLGITPAAVTKICDLDEDDITGLLTSPAQIKDSSFLSNLKKAFADNVNNKASDDNLAGNAEYLQQNQAEKDGRDSENDF